MPSILSKEDKTVVKRAVPSPSNNIITVAVARLYVNYPNKHRWNFTGISGAVVLAEDLVGHTFFFKIVDVIVRSNKGVMWDQELYEGFKYNHDRTFFHTFELEDCMAGFSFADEKEAGRFRDKVETREKYAKSKGRPAGFSVHIPHPHIPHMGRSDSISRNSPSPPAPKAQNGGDVPFSIDNPDPEFQALLKELMDMGITADQIKDNEDFIKSYIAEKEKNAEAEKRKRLSNGNGNGVHVMEVPGSPRGFDRSGKAPPPPPPAPPKSAPPPPSVPPPPPVLRNGIGQLSPQTTGSSTKSRRGLPPPPPIPRGSRRLASQSTGSSPPPPSSRSPAPPPPRATSPPTQPRFVVPPPLPTAGAYANSAPPPRPPLPPTERAPPLPPKTPLEENTGTKFAVPPPFQPPSRPPQAPPQLPPQAPPQLPPQAPPQLPPQAPPQLPPQPPPQAPQNRGLPVPVLPSRPAFPAPPPPPRPPVEAPPPTIRGYYPLYFNTEAITNSSRCPTSSSAAAAVPAPSGCCGPTTSSPTTSATPTSIRTTHEWFPQRTSPSTSPTTS
ncbi:hypothetical protein DFP73DRAFT_484924 [Morchella snyderi]|nr:hypothetical protein DFP73DRAFT_484924 [Morchella snyderi]